MPRTQTSAAILSAVMMAGLVPGVALAADAVVVNGDGSTKFNYPATGPYFLGTLAPVTKTAAFDCGTETPIAGKHYILSGAGYSVTLPPAVTAGPGAVLIFSVPGTAADGTQFTLVPGNGNILDGRSGGLALIATNSITLISDGSSSWISITKNLNTNWKNAGAIVFSCSGATAPQASPSAINRCFWRRSGDSIDLRYEFLQTSSTGAIAGAGDYRLAVPAGFEIDTTKTNASDSAGNVLATSVSVGNGSMTSGSTVAAGSICVVDKKRLGFTFIFSGGSDQEDRGTWRTSNVGNRNFALTNASLGFGFQASIPIINW